jgi:hypothetical protein
MSPVPLNGGADAPVFRYGFLRGRLAVNTRIALSYDTVETRPEFRVSLFSIGAGGCATSGKFSLEGCLQLVVPDSCESECFGLRIQPNDGSSRDVILCQSRSGASGKHLGQWRQGISL